MWKKTIAAVLFIAPLVGCATHFTGEAHIEGGPAGCQAKCQSWGQEFVGMIAMGEYSDACICRVPGKQVSLNTIAGGIGGGAAGVMMQMRRESENSSAH